MDRSRLLVADTDPEVGGGYDEEHAAESSSAAQARASAAALDPRDTRHAAAKRRRSSSAPPSPNIGYEADPTRTLRPRRNSRTSTDKSAATGSDSGSEGSDSDEEETDPADWVYVLVVVQHPQRARACGFGDKDRRPLSPPPIVRLYVRTLSGRLVDPTEIDIQFLVMMVDLWSADGEHQRNVVMHTTPNTRPTTPPSRGREEDVSGFARPGTASSRPVTAGSRPPTATSRPATGYASAFSPGLANPGWRLTGQIPLIPPSSSQGPSPRSRYNTEQVPPQLPIPATAFGSLPPPRPLPYRGGSYTGRLQTTQSRPPSSHAEAPRPVTAPSQPTSYNLPSLASVTDNLYRPSSSRLTLAAIRSPRDRPMTATTDTSGHPSWTTESTQITDYSFNRSSGSTRNTSISSVDERERNLYGFYYPPPSPGYYSGPAAGVTPSSPIYPTALTPVMEGSGSATSQHENVNAPPSPPRDEDEQETAGASYSRVLVGSLCATCLRLQDEHGEQGLFFFAHDLGIRTEGQFRLKFALTNIASALGRDVTKNQSMPVLAEALSDPFTVYSAKRFPGVVPTTNLTKLFAGQNVRLPTRQRRTQGGDEADDE